MMHEKAALLESYAKLVVGCLACCAIRFLYWQSPHMQAGAVAMLAPQLQQSVCPLYCTAGGAVQAE